jgi:archaetidylinositol phosphate synthase
MVLNKYRGKADKILTPFARAFSGLNPNTLSAASVVFALLAGIALVHADQARIEDYFNPGHYLYIMFAIASVCIFLNGFLDAVDGKVARLMKSSSLRGDFLDHALDRYADILILGGIMLSPYCDTVIGALAIIAVLMTSYMGTQAQALGCGRDYGGLLGRADRLVILILAPLIQMGVVYYFASGRLPIVYIENFTILEWIMLWFIIAGNITAIHRGIHSWRELRDKEKPVGGQKKLDHFNESGQSELTLEPIKPVKPKRRQKPIKPKQENKVKRAYKKRKRQIKPKGKDARKPVKRAVNEFQIDWDDSETNSKTSRMPRMKKSLKRTGKVKIRPKRSLK